MPIGQTDQRKFVFERLGRIEWCELDILANRPVEIGLAVHFRCLVKHIRLDIGVVTDVPAQRSAHRYRFLRINVFGERFAGTATDAIEVAIIIGI